MGTVLVGYGDAAYDHEGYAAQVLDDGSLTGTYSNETMPRMIGQVVAACECGWTGSTRYPAVDVFDDAAEELALAEWEHTHAVPVLRRTQADKWDQLCVVVRRLADSHSTATRELVERLSPDARLDFIDETLAALDRARELAGELRRVWEWPD